MGLERVGIDDRKNLKNFFKNRLPLIRPLWYNQREMKGARVMALILGQNFIKTKLCQPFYSLNSSSLKSRFLF